MERGLYAIAGAIVAVGAMAVAAWVYLGSLPDWTLAAPGEGQPRSSVWKIERHTGLTVLCVSEQSVNLGDSPLRPRVDLNCHKESVP